MARFLKNKQKSHGQAPGEPIFIGVQKVPEPTIRLIDYDKESLSEKELKDIKDGVPYLETSTVTWINIYGLHDTDLIRKVGHGFGLHPLVTADLVNTGQRPKMEDYDDYLYFCIKMMRYDEPTGRILSEQLSMILGKTFLLTFQERPGDVFEPVRERIRKSKGRIREVGIDYLAYALLDTIVDNYIMIIERLGEQIEDLEERILSNSGQAVLPQIINFKREMNYLRKAIIPAREFILQLSMLDTDLIHDTSRPFLKDLLALANQSVEVTDTYRDMLSDYLNMYNSGVSNKLNEIMKILTMFSAIFIPLTFIAGVYGTNFINLPEIHLKYGYYLMWGVMLIVFLGMIHFFRKKNWL